MKWMWKIFKWFLIVWGAVCLLAVLLFLGCIFFPDRPVTKPVSKKNVEFVLNGCNLGDRRIEEVVHSYMSTRSFTGDHLDGHAIRVSHLDASELVDLGEGNGWYRGDTLSGVAQLAVDYTAGCLHEMPWFPTIGKIRSSSMYVYVVSITSFDVNGRQQVHTMQVIFASPDDKMIYYLELVT